MKIDRLIGILSVLLQNEKVSVPYLAEKFEVSRRTINRDIESLCQAGIPIVTTQGAGGGISILDGYKMDRTLLTSSDMQAILAGLKSLDSAWGTNRYQQLMEKLFSGGGEKMVSSGYIRIDLASWYKTSIGPKITLIQSAIEETKLLSFEYCSPQGEGKRIIEPYLLVFQWAAWYVWGYCREREDYRMFKLNRMLNVKEEAETFFQREYPPLDLTPQKVFPVTIEVKVKVEPAMKWRLVEEFGVESFSVQKDGTLLFRFGFSDRENLFRWLLSFGDQVELLEPENLRQEFVLLVKNISEKYAGQ